MMALAWVGRCMAAGSSGTPAAGHEDRLVALHAQGHIPARMLVGMASDTSVWGRPSASALLRVLVGCSLVGRMVARRRCAWSYLCWQSGTGGVLGGACRHTILYWFPLPHSLPNPCIPHCCYNNLMPGGWLRGPAQRPDSRPAEAQPARAALDPHTGDDQSQ